MRLFPASALALLGLMACVDPGDVEAPREGPVGPVGDDPTGDPDPAITLDPDTVLAGSFVDIDVTLVSFDLSGADVAHGPSSEEVVFHSIQGTPEGDLFTMRFHFGLLAEGLHPWGLANLDGILMGQFEVEPLGGIPDLEPGFPADVVESSPDQLFAAWEVETPPASYQVIRVRPDDAGLTPLVWLLADDGVTVIEEITEPAFLSFYSELQFDGFLRVQDALMGGLFPFEIDLAIIPAGDPELIEEIEPNDAVDDWHDLGVLEPGRRTITGFSTFAGHDENNDPNGDLDVFTFELAEAGRVVFDLVWESSDDFDAVLYVHADGEDQLGFQSPQAVDLSMATLSRPEQADLLLEAGTRYTLMIANWQGDPAAPWTLDLNVYPGSFPED